MLKISICLLSLGFLSAIFIGTDTGNIYNNSNLIFSFNSSYSIKPNITAVGYCGQNYLIADASANLHLLTPSNILYNLGTLASGEYVSQIMNVQNTTFFITYQYLYQMSPSCTSWTQFSSNFALNTNIAVPTALDQTLDLIYISCSNPDTIVSYNLQTQDTSNVGSPAELGSSPQVEGLTVGPNSVLYASFNSSISNDIFVYSYGSNLQWSQVCSQPGMSVQVSVIAFDQNENLVIGAADDDGDLFLYFLTYVQGECVWAQYVSSIPFTGAWYSMIIDEENNVNAVVVNQDKYSFYQYNQITLSWSSCGISQSYYPYLLSMNYANYSNLIIADENNILTLTSGIAYQITLNYDITNNNIIGLAADSKDIFVAFQDGHVIKLNSASPSPKVLGVSSEISMYGALESFALTTTGDLYVGYQANQMVFFYNQQNNQWISTNYNSYHRSVDQLTTDNNGCLYVLGSTTVPDNSYISQYCNNSWQEIEVSNNADISDIALFNDQLAYSSNTYVEGSEIYDLILCQISDNACSIPEKIPSNESIGLVVLDSSGNPYYTTFEEIEFYDVSANKTTNLNIKMPARTAVSFMAYENGHLIVIDSENNFYTYDGTWNTVNYGIQGNVLAIATQSGSLLEADISF